MASDAAPRNGSASVNRGPASGSAPTTGDKAGAASEDVDQSFDMDLIGASDQACKECRRRKAKCNRAIPTCDLCIKYRRHCLYEKHSRTPLTRKHLTQVEARLERAEAVVKQMRTLVPPHLRTWERQESTAGPAHPPGSPKHFDFAKAPELDSDEARGGPENDASDFGTLRTADADHQRMMEGPPIDDFEWHEQDAVHPEGFSPETIGDSSVDDVPLSDGMASLTVNEREAGYLGVASGAALLRLLEPARRQTTSRQEHVSPSIYSMTPQPNPNRHVAESMIDAYFRLYHVSYPIIHEPTFRAQYNEVIPRPNGPCWTVLAYVVAAIGVWTSASSSADTLDLALFSQARSILSFDFLEVGNLTLLQALTLASNYQQKRDKPNSGYNYLGLAVRMAMGLGLHKEFQGWNISPLTMEIRRRVWWVLGVFDMGATITFSRPDVWPYKGVEVSFPLNVNDKDLTAASQSYPPESNEFTSYSAVASQARFHIATHECFEKVISKPFPSAEQMLRMEATLIDPWKAGMPSYISEQAEVPSRYALAQSVMAWRLRNLRIIMYRPFVIRRALRRKVDPDKASMEAYDRCLADAKSTIEMISTYWRRHEHNRLAAWYGLYFIFQAALIPCICLRNEPSSPVAADWRTQITITLQAIEAMAPVNASSSRCYRIISDLCGQYLDNTDALLRPLSTQQTQVATHNATDEAVPNLQPWPGQNEPVGESAQMQINSVFSMMWPNLPPLEAADEVMGDDAGWMEFLRAGSAEDWESFGV